MVFRIDTTDRAVFAARLDRVRELISARVGDYGRMLSAGMNQREADRSVLESGRLSETDMLQIYCRAWEVEPLDENGPGAFEPWDGAEADYLLNHQLLPLRWDGSEVVFAAADPYDLLDASYVIGTFSGLSVAFEFGRRSMIERLLEQTYAAADAVPDDRAPDDESELLRLAGEAGIVRIVNEMLTQALEQNASDIHIEPGENALMIRFRIDGILNDYLKLPRQDYPAIASRIKLVGGLNIAESRLPQDGRTDFQIANYDIDIRISTIPVMNGESIVLRLLHREAMRFDLRELGMDAELLKRFEKLIAIPHGIILVVGPTGSGKTTTLYSVMRQLNVRQRKIITIEDPVEYQLPGLSQMQVNTKIGLSFANGLRHIVRQDPDVILVGEIRDRETADIAINAALTGHLVLSTLHTNDAVGAVTRLVDMGVEPFLISASLAGVLSQRLVRTICPVCGGSGSADGGRCRRCQGSGFRGRTGIFELLVFNDAMREAVHAGASADEMTGIALAHGMIPLAEDGRRKVEAGVTTEAEILRMAEADFEEI